MKVKKKIFMVGLLPPFLAPFLTKTVIQPTLFHAFAIDINPFIVGNRFILIKTKN